MGFTGKPIHFAIDFSEMLTEIVVFEPRVSV